MKEAEKVICDLIYSFIDKNFNDIRYNLSEAGLPAEKGKFLNYIKDDFQQSMWILTELTVWGIDKAFFKEFNDSNECKTTSTLDKIKKLENKILYLQKYNHSIVNQLRNNKNYEDKLKKIISDLIIENQAIKYSIEKNHGGNCIIVSDNSKTKSIFEEFKNARLKLASNLSNSLDIITTEKLNSKSKTINQNILTSDCWAIQFKGLSECNKCEFKDTKECGGGNTLKMLKNIGKWITTDRENLQFMKVTDNTTKFTFKEFDKNKYPDVYENYKGKQDLDLKPIWDISKFWIELTIDLLKHPLTEPLVYTLINYKLNNLDPCKENFRKELAKYIFEVDKQIILSNYEI